MIYHFCGLSQAQNFTSSVVLILYSFVGIKGIANILLVTKIATSRRRHTALIKFALQEENALKCKLLAFQSIQEK